MNVDVLGTGRTEGFFMITFYARFLLMIVATVMVLPLWAAEKRLPAAKAPPLLVFDRVRFLPAPHHERDMPGGKFCGSNVSATEGYKVLAEIKAVPPAEQWSEISFDNRRPYRWIRYEAPPGSFGHVNKIEFYAGPRKLGGPTFGSIGYTQVLRKWTCVFDGKDVRHRAWFDSDSPDGQYVGMDVGDLATARHPVMDPPPGEFQKPLQVTLKSPTPGAVIRYTLDGTLPGPNSGTLYRDSIGVADTTTIVAVALAEGLAPSPATEGIYRGGPSAKPGLSTFHIGNSLTQTASRFSIYAETAGFAHAYQKYLQPGIWTCALWETDVLKTKDPWEKTLAAIAHLDHFTLQPRDPDIAHEARYDILFFDLIRNRFPAVQPWFYAEWPVPRERGSAWDLATIPSLQMKQVVPALTWEESASARMLYIEDLQAKVAETYHAGKHPRVLPAALAMGWLKHQLDEGKIPDLGPKDFDPIMYRDCVHPGPAGAYLIDLVWYAAFYRQSPEGRVLPVGAGLTSPQATALQRLAWDVVKNYPDCGLYEEGAAPVGPPQFVPASRKLSAITRVMLSSATPGAWFRYTLDGTTPSRTRGYLYCGVISVRPETTVKAIAFKSGMADSPVIEATYPGDQPVFNLPPIPENVVLERDIQYGQGGEHPLLLDILRPKAESERPLPVVLFIHGGGWSGGDKASAIGLLLPYAASGQYFCATANYRLTGQAPWPAQLYDCKAAIRWLKSRAHAHKGATMNIDPDRIGVWGHSAGGHLAAMLGLTGGMRDLEGQSGWLGNDSRVACAVDWSGPADLVKFFAANGKPAGCNKLFGGPLGERLELARQASPLTYAMRNVPPMLIVHGTDDKLVPFEQSEVLSAALKQAGADATMIKMVGGGHNIFGSEIAQRTRDFFDKYLRGQKVQVSGAPIQAPAEIPAEVKRKRSPAPPGIWPASGHFGV